MTKKICINADDETADLWEYIKAERSRYFGRKLTNSDIFNIVVPEWAAAEKDRRELHTKWYGIKMSKS